MAIRKLASLIPLTSKIKVKILAIMMVDHLTMCHFVRENGVIILPPQPIHSEDGEILPTKILGGQKISQQLNLKLYKPKEILD